MPPQPIPDTSTDKKVTKGAPAQPAYNPLSGGSANAGSIKKPAPVVKKKKTTSVGADDRGGQNEAVIAKKKTTTARNVVAAEPEPRARGRISKPDGLPDVGKSEPVAQRRLAPDLTEWRNTDSWTRYSTSRSSTPLTDNTPAPARPASIESIVTAKPAENQWTKPGQGTFAGYLSQNQPMMPFAAAMAEERGVIPLLPQSNVKDEDREVWRAQQQMRKEYSRVVDVDQEVRRAQDQMRVGFEPTNYLGEDASYIVPGVLVPTVNFRHADMITTPEFQASGLDPGSIPAWLMALLWNPNGPNVMQRRSLMETALMNSPQGNPLNPLEGYALQEAYKAKLAATAGAVADSFQANAKDFDNLSFDQFWSKVGRAALNNFGNVTGGVMSTVGDTLTTVTGGKAPGVGRSIMTFATGLRDVLMAGGVTGTDFLFRTPIQEIGAAYMGAPSVPGAPNLSQFDSKEESLAAFMARTPAQNLFALTSGVGQGLADIIANPGLYYERSSGNFFEAAGTQIEGYVRRNLVEETRNNYQVYDAKLRAEEAAARATGDMLEADRLKNLRVNQGIPFAAVAIDTVELRTDYYEEAVGNPQIGQQMVAEAAGIFKNAMAMPAYTLAQKESRDYLLAKAAAMHAEGYMLITSNPLMLTRQYESPLQNVVDILMPNVFFDLVPFAFGGAGLWVKKGGAKAISDAADVSGVDALLRSAADIPSVESIADAQRAAEAAKVALRQAEDVRDALQKAEDEIAAQTGFSPRRASNAETRKAEVAAVKAYNAAVEASATLNERRARAQAWAAVRTAADAEARAAAILGIDSTKLGRRNGVISNVLGRSTQSAAQEQAFHLIPAMVDVFRNVQTVADARVIVAAMQDTKKFLGGIAGNGSHIWQSDLLNKATHAGSEPLMLSIAPYGRKAVRRALRNFQQIIPEFLEASEALRADGFLNKELLLQEISHAVQVSFSRESGSATALANLPFGAAKAATVTGRPLVRIVDNAGNVLKTEVAGSIADASVIAKHINDAIGGKSIFKENPVWVVPTFVGKVMRKAFAVPFIGWNPANLIQQAANPIVNSLLDGVSVFGRDNSIFGRNRMGLRSVQHIDDHIRRLLSGDDAGGTGRVGMRDISPLDEGLLGVSGYKRTWMNPLGPEYKKVEEGMGLRFKYDAMTKFIQQYGRATIDKVIVPRLVALGLPPELAQKAGQAFYDAAYANGQAAGIRAAMDVIDGGTRRTLSQFDPLWESYVPMDVAAKLQEVLNSFTDAADAEVKIRQFLADAHREWTAMMEGPATGTRHSFERTAQIEDLAQLRAALNSAVTHGGDKIKLEAEFKKIQAQQANMRAVMNGLTQLLKTKKVGDAQALLYSLWQDINDGRTRVHIALDEAAQGIHLAGGKELWATEYWPKAAEQWTGFIDNMTAALEKAKAALESDDLSSYRTAVNVAGDHARHTDEFLSQQIEYFKPRSGLWDSTFKVVQDAARELEKNQHARFWQVVNRLPDADASRVFDEMVSAERDIAAEGARIRLKLDEIVAQVLKEVKKTKDNTLWNGYFDARNKLWGEFFASYVPERWRVATEEVAASTGRNGGQVLQEAALAGQNVSPARAAELRNIIRENLKDLVPTAREKKPTNVRTLIPDRALKFVNVEDLKMELGRIISENDGTFDVIAANRRFNFDDVKEWTDNAWILNDGTKVYYQSVRKVVATALPDVGKKPRPRVIFSREGSPAWQAAAKKTPPITQTHPTVSMIQGIGNQALSIIYTNNPAFGGLADDTGRFVRGNGWFTVVARQNISLAEDLLEAAVENLERQYPKAASRIRKVYEDKFLVWKDKDRNSYRPLVAEESLPTYRAVYEDAIGKKNKWLDVFQDGTPKYMDAIDDIYREIEKKYDGVPKSFNEAMEEIAPETFNRYFRGKVTDAAELYETFLSEFMHSDLTFDGANGMIRRGNFVNKVRAAFKINEESARSLQAVTEEWAHTWAKLWREDPSWGADTIDSLAARWYDHRLQDILDSSRVGSQARDVGMSGNAGAWVETVKAPHKKTRSLMRVFSDMMGMPEEQRLQIALHEFFHVYHNDLIFTAQRGSVRAQELSTALYEFVTDKPYVKGSAIEWGTDELERLAVGFERYSRTGKAPTSKLTAVFEKFKQWFDGVVRWYKEYNDWWTEVSKETGLPREAPGNIGFQIFDEMLGGRRANIKPSTLPDVGQTVQQVSPAVSMAKATGTVQGFDNAVMNALRKELRAFDPALMKMLGKATSLDQIDPRYLPFLQELAKLHELRASLSLATSQNMTSTAMKLQPVLDKAVADLRASYADVRASINAGVAAANRAPNTKSPNSAAYAGLWSLEKLDKLGDRMIEAIKNPPADKPPVPPPGAALKAADFLNTEAQQMWSDVLYGANVAGDKARSYTMIDFWNKTRADDILQLFMPFPFWRTRDIKNSFRRFAAVPGYVYHTERIKRELEQQSRIREGGNSPARLDAYWQLPDVGQDLLAGTLGKIFPVGGENVDISYFARWLPNMMSPTIIDHLGGNSKPVFEQEATDPVVSAMMDVQNVGFSMYPFMTEYAAHLQNPDAPIRVADWTAQTRAASWTAVAVTPPEYWGMIPSIARADWMEHTIARELVNMAQRGEIDPVTLTQSTDYLYQIFSGEKPLPEWDMLDDVGKQKVWTVLKIAGDAAAAKQNLSNVTRSLTTVNVQAYDTAESDVMALAKQRSDMYYHPERNPVGTSEAAYFLTAQEPGLLAKDMQAGVQNQKKARPGVTGANALRRADMLEVEKQKTQAQQDAVSALLKVDPKATKTEMNQAKVKGLIPIAVEVLGKEAVDAWLEAEFKSNNGKPSSNYVGLSKLIDDAVKARTPSAFTDRADPTTIPGTPKAEIANVLQHGSPWAQTTDINAIKSYIDATDRLPSPVNPRILQQEYMQNAIYLVRDLYPYPDYDKVGAKNYARGAEKADQQRAEQLSKLLDIPVEEAAQLLEDYANRYMGEDEIARRGEIDAQGYRGGSSSWSRNYYRRYNRGWSSYRGGGGGWSGGGGWNGGGGGGASDGQSDLLPSIEEYIRRQQRLSGALWRLPSSKYGVG